MKILAIGDFHGKFPMSLRRLAREVDLVVCTGDFFPWSFNDIFLKHGEVEQKLVLALVDEEEYSKTVEQELIEGEKVIAELNSLGRRVFTTIGNYDRSGVNDQYVECRGMGSEEDLLEEILRGKENIERIDYRLVEFGGLSFIGGFGHSSPGDPRSKAFRESKKKLRKLFSKARGPVVFVCHNMPYGCLDELDDGGHVGSKLMRFVVDELRPEILVGGHIHERQGEEKVGGVRVVNCGAAVDGKAVVIEVDGGRVKSVQFVK